MAKIIEYNEELNNELNKRLIQMREKTEQCAQKMVNNYSGYTSRGILSETVNDLNKNFNSLGDVTTTTANSFLKHGSEMIDYDKSVAVEINGMDIPHDFEEENAIEINTYNATILSKLDSKSISKDKNTDEQNIDESTVIASTDIFNMNEGNTKERKYDDTTVIGESILGRVNGGTTKEQDLDASTSISNVYLNGVQGGNTTEQNYNDSSIISNVNLNEIKGGNTTEQSYDDTTVVGESILGSINSDKNDTKMANVDEAVAAIEQHYEDIKKDEERV